MPSLSFKLRIIRSFTNQKNNTNGSKYFLFYGGTRNNFGSNFGAVSQLLAFSLAETRILATISRSDPFHRPTVLVLAGYGFHLYYQFIPVHICNSN